jgi:hypothetical protein
MKLKPVPFVGMTGGESQKKGAASQPPNSGVTKLESKKKEEESKGHVKSAETQLP